jgi:hypothetical protein
LDEKRLFVGPVALDKLPVPAVRLAAADRDDLETIRAGLESAGHMRCDTNHIPLFDLNDLVIQLDTA